MVKQITALSKTPAANPEFPAPSKRPIADPTNAAKAVLMDYHSAAADANGKRFFRHLADDAIVLGTDPKERFTLAQLRALAEPHFKNGNGWKSVPKEQSVFLSKDGRLAWFDERLMNSKYGEMRGTGVMLKTKGEWKIAHYNTAFPVPNALAKQVIGMIREGAK